MTKLRITEMTSAHAAGVLRIYQHGIDEGNATFETVAPTWEAFDAAKSPAHRFVAVAGDDEGDGDAGDAGDDEKAVLGWIAASQVSKRACYAGVIEHSVYVAPEARGLGVGGQLLKALITSSEAAGIWTIQSGIFPENAASIQLHAKHGFRTLGRQEKIGRGVGGVWRDVVLLERRSAVVR
jgi:L-amino acid N-acyltransferase YncA